MANAHDVAAYVIRHFKGERISTMKLQKLCYIAQGWSLALRGEPLTGAMFQAWRNGPVTRALYPFHRGEYGVDSWPWGTPENLNESERIVLDAVLTNYESLTGLQLSDLTHKAGTPWSTTRELNGVPDGASSEVEISNELIRSHYLSSLGLDSRD